MRGLTAASLLAGAAVAAGTGLAVGAGGGSSDGRGPLTATPCAGPARSALRLSGRLDATAQGASLLARDGSSVQAVVRGRRVTFLVPMHQPESAQPRRLTYVDTSGRSHSARVDVTAASRATCPPPRPVSVGLPARGPGRVQLRLRPVTDAGGPSLDAEVYGKRGAVCVRVGRGPRTQRCMPMAFLGRQEGLQGWAYRLPHAVTVLSGVVDRSLIRAVRVREHGWPPRTGVTLPLSRSGAFALAETGAFADGVTWELRPVYRHRHAPVMRLVGIGPVLSGPGGAPADHVNAQLLAHYAVLRRPSRPGDELPRMPRVHSRGIFRDVNPRFARLVADRAGVKVWMVPGERALCTVERFSGHAGGGAGCGPANAAGYANGHAPPGFSMIGPWSWRPHRRLAGVLLPDGSSDARLERGGRTLRHVAIRDNAAVARTAGATTLSWLAPDGSRHRINFGSVRARRRAPGPAAVPARARTPRDRARSLAFRAVGRAASRPACKPVPPTGRAPVVDDAPRASIAAVFPPVPRESVRAAAAARRLARFSGPLLRGTARLVDLGHGEQVLVFVTRGSGWRAPRDPATCRAARHNALHAIHPRADALRAAAQDELDVRADTVPGAQSVNVFEIQDGRPTGGTSIVVTGGWEPGGIVYSGGRRRGTTTYVGIAKRGATTVVVTSTKGRTVGKVVLRRRVRQRLFAFTVARGTGRLVLRQRHRSGRVVASEALRR